MTNMNLELDFGMWRVRKRGRGANSERDKEERKMRRESYRGKDENRGKKRWQERTKAAKLVCKMLFVPWERDRGRVRCPTQKAILSSLSLLNNSSCCMSYLCWCFFSVELRAAAEDKTTYCHLHGWCLTALGQSATNITTMFRAVQLGSDFSIKNH